MKSPIVEEAIDCLSEICEEKSNAFQLDSLRDQIFIGDCLEIMRKTQDRVIDLCITDPPWGIDYKSFREKFSDEKIANDEYLEYKRLMREFPKELFRIMKRGSSAYVFCGATTPTSSDGEIHWAPYDMICEFHKVGFKPRRIIVWDKITPGRGYRYRLRAEFVLYLTKGSKKFRGDGEYRDEIIECDPEIEMFRYQKLHGANKYHPMEKPIRIYESFIEDSSNPNDLVIDPFAGSGPVIEACKNTGRYYLAIEKEQGYRSILEFRTRQQTIFQKIPMQTEIEPEDDNDGQEGQLDF